MVEYHKIETIFERDTGGSRKLIEGLYRNEAVEFLRNNMWEFTEKIDGTNIRICWDGHRVEIAGRTDRAMIPPHLLRCLEELFKTDVAEELFEQKFGDKEVILFGEGYGPKIQACGGKYRDSADFILFDVLIGNNYQPRETVEDVAKMFGIDVVPIVCVGDLDDGIAFVKSKPKSTFGTADMEGVVGRPMVEMRDRCGKRVIVKIKARDFE